MSIFTGGGGQGRNIMNWVVTALSIVMGFAITFVFTPQIHGATVNWALGYMQDNYGSWMVAIGWFFWWIIVALLTFLISVLSIMMTIMIGTFGFQAFTLRFGR